MGFSWAFESGPFSPVNTLGTGQDPIFRPSPAPETPG